MRMGERRRPPSREQAEAIAARALQLLAEDAAHLGRFLAVTGIEPGDLRTMAGSPAFLAGVLTYVCQDESLLLVLAEAAGLPPERIADAELILAGPAGH